MVLEEKQRRRIEQDGAHCGGQTGQLGKIVAAFEQTLFLERAQPARVAAGLEHEGRGEIVEQFRREQDAPRAREVRSRFT